MATTVVMIRHGESQLSVDRRYGGRHECEGLSNQGRDQVERLRRRLAASGELDGASALYTSELLRAQQTAEPIAELLELEPHIECDLCEVHDGDELSGLSVDEVRDRFWAPAYEAGLRVPWSALAPGTESWAECVVRVGRLLQRLALEHRDQKIVLVGHAGPIRAAFVAFGSLPLLPPMALYVENTSITEWRSEPDGSTWPWGLHRYNDHSHLNTLDS